MKDCCTTFKVIKIYNHFDVYLLRILFKNGIERFIIIVFDELKYFLIKMPDFCYYCWWVKRRLDWSWNCGLFTDDQRLIWFINLLNFKKNLISRHLLIIRLYKIGFQLKTCNQSNFNFLWMKVSFDFYDSVGGIEL